LKSLENADSNTCLDLGCGDGALLSALKDRGYFVGKSVVAVDIAANRIELVRKIGQDFECIVADGCGTQITDGSIDFLISTQVIEHVANDYDMVREMRRLLREGGFLYLSTVFKKKYGRYFYRCNGEWTLDPTHLREYTNDDRLLDILEAHGFDILENKKTLDGCPIMESVLRRLHAPRRAYNNLLFKLLRMVKIPIPGYYQWELVCQKG
jgi:2-polyprenyl-3-methyl-5-hydroxy-6-metoxy-1,4-benzoquinol methylase